MSKDFSRIITLLRKERGMTQKEAAAHLGVSQALLSHYEKGIRDSAKDGIFRGSLLPTLNKKLIANSLNILFDKLNSCPNKGLVGEISGYLMLAVYRMFRLLYASNPKNAPVLFSVPTELCAGYADAEMARAASNTGAILAGQEVGLGEPVRDTSAFAMTTESLSRDYPLYATSLLNLIKASERRMKRPSEKD